MSLLTLSDLERLHLHGRAQRTFEKAGHPFRLDFPPVIKLFTPDAGATWLLSEVYPDDPEIAFGLCDLGVGFPELGDVSLAELAEVRGPFGLHVERDRGFLAQKPLSAYAREAHQAGRIIA